MIGNIHLQDCIEGMLALEAKSIDIVTTSPPYNLNIDYSTYDDTQSREQYLLWLNDVFIAVKHCLKDDGHFWLNMGYSNVDPWVGMDAGNVARKHFVLQNNFNWIKSIAIDDTQRGHYKPINSERYANPTWEHLFHFTKDGNVKCNKLALGVPYIDKNNIDNTTRLKGRIAKRMGFTNIRDYNKNATEEQTTAFNNELQLKLNKQKPRSDVHCKGNSWYIPYDTITNKAKHRGNHPATYPVALIEHCIKFSNLNGASGVLLDPFMGSGTSAVAAQKQGLTYIGYDIDPEYIKFAEDRIKYNC